MKRIILKPHEERRILLGHPWVYDNEIASVLDGPQAAVAVLEPGELADVESSGKKYLGRAFVNPNSKIVARIYSPSKEGVDKGFFKSRIRKAILARSGYDLQRESARLVFAEADFLPALIIDRFVGWPLDSFEAALVEHPYEAALVEHPYSFEDARAALGAPASWGAVQFLSWGIDERREMILDALYEVLAVPLQPGMEPLGTPAGTVEKSGARVRELEGLPLREGLVRGSFPASGIVIFENGLPFMVHLEAGQKTGHYLDQRDNRRLAASCLPGSKVLDAYAYTGGFGIHAARAGAESVVCVDVSAAALEALGKNAALNGVSDRIKPVEADVFEYLRAVERKKDHYDLIILDPPAFAKTRASLEGAIRGYKEINLRAISLLSSGGILVTCSCSQTMDERNFKKMVSEAAADAQRRLVQIDFRYQASDHPILSGYDESFYLKCGFYKVLN
jgi:23S rRNA (cytosine1962-C5)-methyltransferase